MSARMAEIEIKKLKFPESIRRRSSMYIGSTENPAPIFREIVDNSCDELMNGYASHILIERSNTFTIVADNGRGVPVYVDPDHKDRLITRSLFTETHVGSKFDPTGTGYTAGLNGIGVKATNALSESFRVFVNLNKKNLDTTLPELATKARSCKNPIYCIGFKQGQLDYEDVLGFAAVQQMYRAYRFSRSLWWSTTTLVIPDKTIFKTLRYELDPLPLQIGLSAKPDAQIDIVDNVTGVEYAIQPFSIEQAFKRTEFVDDRLINFRFSFQDTIKAEFLVGLGFSTTDYKYMYRGSVNTLNTNEGYHIRLTLRGLSKLFAEKYDNLSADDFQYGLRLFVLCFCDEPEFSSQSKEKLSWIRNFNEAKFFELLRLAFDKVYAANRLYFDKIRLRLFEYKVEIGRLSVKEYVDSVVIKGDDAKRTRGLGTIVHDCNTRNRELAELFIVEGNSAGSTALQVRSVVNQALLPLRGKPLNSAQRELATVLKNREMQALINVIGAGVHPYSDISKARYGKIILMADGDEDGKSINNLLLGTLATYIPGLIDAKMVYIARVPLFRQGDRYFWSIEGLDPKKPFQRFKGLAEFNSSELKQTVIHPKTRNLVLVTAERIDEALSIIKSTTEKFRIMQKHGVVV